MTIRSNYDALSIARVEGAQPLDIPSLDIGMHRPLGVGAGSLAILSALPDDEIERIVSANARRLAAFGKLTVPLLLDIARQSREAGYGIHDGRMIAGVSGVGFLVHDSSGAAGRHQRFGKGRQPAAGGAKGYRPNSEEGIACDSELAAPS